MTVSGKLPMLIGRRHDNMNIALKQSQKQQNDLYNLWKYPLSRSSMSAIPSSVFKPEFNKWSKAADVGYINSSGDLQCKYGNNWFSAMRTWGYQVGTFIDLSPDVYTMNFKCDSLPVVVIVTYIKLADGYVKFGGNMMTFIGQIGRNEFTFEIPPEVCPMFQFFVTPENQYGTFSEILIR